MVATSAAVAAGALRTGLLAALAGTGVAGSHAAKRPPIDLVYVDGGAIYVGYSADRPAPQTSSNETNTAAAHRRSLGIDGSEPRWSPDASRIVFVKPVGKNGGELWSVGVDGKGARRLTQPPAGWSS